MNLKAQIQETKFVLENSKDLCNSSQEVLSRPVVCKDPKISTCYLCLKLCIANCIEYTTHIHT